MIARLTVHLPRQPTKTFLARKPGGYSLGRDPESDFVLDDSRVSRRHATLRVGEEGCEIVDEGSKNGLSVDGEKVDSAALTRACWVSLGGLMARFEPLQPESEWSAERSRRWHSSLEAHQTLGQSGQSPDALVQRLIASVIDITRAERGFVLMPSSDGDLRIVGSSVAGEDDAAFDSFPGTTSTVYRVLESGEPIVESDVVDDAILAGRPSVVAGGIRGLVCLPLEAAGERLGALYADSTVPGAAFDELDLELVRALASHAALALWVAGVHSELAGLTGSLPTAFGETEEAAASREPSRGPTKEP